MSLFWKIFWTVVIIITGAVAMAAVINFFDILINDCAINFEFFLTLLGAGLAAVPAWFAWKGTKLVPLLTNVVVRVILIIIGCFVPILLVIFALIGIWLKS